MRVGGHGSFIDNIVLFIFFEKGNPHPRRARPEAPYIWYHPGLIFHFREKNSTLFPGFDNFWFYRSPNFVSMRWSQVFSYVFPSFASFYALDSSHSDCIVSAQNFQCVGCKINLFDLFFSKNPFCSPRVATPFVLLPQKGISRIVQPGALRTPKAVV